MDLPGPSETSPEITVPLAERPLLGLLQRSLGGGRDRGVLRSPPICSGFWLAPSGQPNRQVCGRDAGNDSHSAFTCSSSWQTKAPFLEPWFGGLDRMYLWHRWCAIAGVVLIFPHYVLVTSVPPTIRNTFGNALGILALFGLVFLLVWALVPRLPVVGPSHSNRLPALVHAPPVHGAVRHRWVGARFPGGPSPRARTRNTRLVYRGGGNRYRRVPVPGAAASLLPASVATQLYRGGSERGESFR